MNLNFIPISKSDLITIKKIYDYYILNTTVTFRTRTIDLEELAKIYPVNHEKYKAFLIIKDQEVAGYCSFYPYKNYEAYGRTAEICVYLNPNKTNQGLGIQAIEQIEKTARERGVNVLLAFITSENETSIKLFEKLGYKSCAFLKNIGEKFNRLLSVQVFEKEL